jgi:hypothetical protein
LAITVIEEKTARDPTTVAHIRRQTLEDDQTETEGLNREKYGGRSQPFGTFGISQNSINSPTNFAGFEL